jgi:hypothetical protein
MIVGIDNGLDGGLCAISAHNGSIIDKTPMPTYMNKKKREVDTKAIQTWIRALNTPFVIAIEEPLKHARSSQAMRSMSISFGKIVGMAESRDFELARIEVHDWQTAVLGKIPKGHTKIAALKVAKKLAPDEDWLATPRCTTPHDGMIDAFLIAKFYLTNRK